MRTKTKEKSLGLLMKVLHGYISLFVRITAANDQGTISCISCGDKMYFSDADCADFTDRDNMATRYHLPNLAPAQRNCNRYDHYNHISAWERKLTAEELAHLEFKSKALTKWMPFELKEMIDEFKLKVSQLRKRKGL